ncbi:amidohydrolase [Dasania marina]|uniref:amidohydrolase n=1 Tax=Dasania marina TaxID=471499 RepID=UPI00036BE507|nr:amidohydrolase [Dasania marina]
MSAIIADRIFSNASIYTVDPDRSWAEAIAIKNGKIIYVGDNNGAEAFWGEHTQVDNLGVKLVLPAFIDSHVHLTSGGIQENECSMDDLKSKDEILAAVKSYIDKQGPDASGWVKGSGWSIGYIPEPRKEWLDEICPHRPIYLNCNDGHSLWVNSKALELAGIDKDTQDPLAGEIQRDPATGEATGLLFDFAGQIVKDAMPVETLEEKVAGLQTGIKLAHQFGITTITEPGLDGDMMAPYHYLSDRGELNIRLRAAMSPINWQPGAFGDEIYDFVNNISQYQRDDITVNSIKIYIDGVIEYGSAAMLEPYLLDDLNKKSKPFHSQERLNKYVCWLDSQGIQVHLHAIGDKGVRMALNAFAAATEANGNTDNRHQICHLEMIHPDDCKRFAELNISATFQSFWAFEDQYKNFLRKAVGDDRVRERSLVIGSVHRAGGRLVGGSDWFVTTLNPLEAIAVAVRRMDPQLPDGAAPIYNDSERVELASMIAAYTINGAYVNFKEDILGSLEVGKVADLIVMDKNLFEIPAADIAKTQVQLTVMNGKNVYQR